MRHAIDASLIVRVVHFKMKNTFRSGSIKHLFGVILLLIVIQYINPQFTKYSNDSFIYSFKVKGWKFQSVPLQNVSKCKSNIMQSMY